MVPGLEGQWDIISSTSAAEKGRHLLLERRGSSTGSRGRNRHTSLLDTAIRTGGQKNGLRAGAGLVSLWAQGEASSRWEEESVGSADVAWRSNEDKVILESWCRLRYRTGMSLAVPDLGCWWARGWAERRGWTG